MCVSVCVCVSVSVCVNVCACVRVHVGGRLGEGEWKFTHNISSTYGSFSFFSEMC